MSQTYQRWQKPNIMNALETRRVLMLVGARQCGKTTLTKMLGNPDAIYVTLDDATILNAAQSDPAGFVKHDDNLMIIDEIQRAPDLLLSIKQDVDKNQKPGRFLVTGSSNIHALPGAKESLAGRVRKIHLRPLAMGEINGAAPQFLQQAFAGKFETAHPYEQSPDDKRSYLGYAMQGGFPEARKCNKPSEMQLWHKDYLSTMLELDLKDVASILKKSTMKKLVKILAAWSSKQMNIAEISGKLSVAKETVSNYINALEALYLIECVPGWGKTDYDRSTKKDKIFMADTGLMSAVLGWQLDKVYIDGDINGKLLETFVFNQLSAIIDASEDDYEIYYYRDRDKREIDFIVEDASGNILGIEVKSGSSVNRSSFKHLEWFKETLANRQNFKGIVLYTGEQVLSFGDGMWAVPMNCMWVNLLEKELTQKAKDYCEKCKSFGYDPYVLKDMLNEMGGAEAIRKLLRKSETSYGFNKLRKAGRLDLSMEALILENPQFHEFFTEDELEKAREWLRECEYTPKP